MSCITARQQATKLLLLLLLLLLLPQITMVLDGYSAPVSAGAFLANVMDGLYDGS
jgi:hypothetical protein